MERAIALHRHGVDGEVAAGRILPPILGEGDDGVAAIGLHIAAEGRDLERALPREGCHGAMRNSGRQSPQPGPIERSRDLLGRQRRRDVDILHRPPCQHVAHRAADDPRSGQDVQHGQKLGIRERGRQ